MEKKNRLLVVGLDGASYRFVEDLLARGELPFLKKLADAGNFQPLESLKIPLTAIAWTASYTGKNPGRSNIPGFVRQQKHSYKWEYVSPAERTSREVWKILGDQGKRSILLGTIFCQNQPDLDGIFIGGEYCGDIRRCVHPEKLKEVVFERFGYQPYTTYGSVAEMRSFIENKFRIAHYLNEHHPWDLFFLGFMEPDTAHAYYHCSDMRFVLEAYRAIDRGLQEFCAAVGEDVDIVAYSDHGNRPYKKAFHVNSWLYRKGLLSIKGRREIRAHHLAQFRKSLANMPGRWGAGKRLLACLYYGGRLATRLFPRLHRLALKCTPWLPALQADEADSKVGRGEQIVIDPGVLFDYGSTQAYAFLNHGGNFAGICVNRKGRYPQGVVEDADYEACREHIISALQETTDPRTGRRVIKNIWRREELFWGPYSEDFPDVVFEAEDDYFTYISEDDVGADNVVFDFENCQHELDGLLLCSGPSFEPGAQVRSQIVDIAPTLLHVLGCAIPADMDGQAIEGVFRPELLIDRPVRRLEQETEQDPQLAEKYNSQEQLLIEKRLRALGYFE